MKQNKFNRKYFDKDPHFASRWKPSKSSLSRDTAHNTNYKPSKSVDIVCIARILFFR